MSSLGFLVHFFLNSQVASPSFVEASFDRAP